MGKCRTVSHHRKKKAAKKAAKARRHGRVVGKRGNYRVVVCS